MGKRIRMPLCRACGRRIRYRHNTWHRFNTALERAALLAVHRDEAPTVRCEANWNPSTETYTKIRDKGHVKVLKGRGWNGLNTFCGAYCAMRWLREHPPEVRWELWPRS